MSGMDGRGAFRLGGWVLLGCAGVLSAGCVSSPTYGTGKTANRQLAEDVSGILSIAPKPRETIIYKPRPELVRPANGEQLAAEPLPEPQKAVAAADNPEWPEAPEERRARIRAEATANRDNPFFEPEVASDGGTQKVASASRGRDIGFRAVDANMNNPAEVGAKREVFNRKLAERNQGDPSNRKYLSEPPLAYRQAADTAPQNDIGEDEWKKEKRLKAEARKKAGTKGKWYDWVPGL